MQLMIQPNCLKNESELLQRCNTIAGLSFAQLADYLNIAIPAEQKRRKGWVGMAIEQALGTTAGNRPLPDFTQLGIELKTLPLNNKGRPAESTFVTSIALLTINQETWENSQCHAKLKRVLWLPIEGERSIPFEQRRIGQGFLWSPSREEETVLANDWQELTSMIITGRLEEINARHGDYLQVRPKAANGKSLCYGYDLEGNKILTLPRGFYLRASFTETLVSNLR